MKIASLFSGAGGLDKGFKQAGFDLIWANEYDPTVWETFQNNFPNTVLDKRSILEIKCGDIPDVDGIIGGPPCQSWSEAGARRGINDSRGKLFFNYIEILKEKQPKFFLAENVAGILHLKHSTAFQKIINDFTNVGYTVSFNLLNANNFGVPQDRLRVIIVGIHNTVGSRFLFPNPLAIRPVLKDAISDLGEAFPALNGGNTNGHKLKFSNHEYMTGGFSTIYMSRNRVRSWNEPSFTIQAGGRHAPIHPSAPKMLLVEKDKRIFVPNQEHLYRRLSVRECARIQTFPDDFIFYYKNIANGYKMVGNAVPVTFAYHIASKIRDCLQREQSNFTSSCVGERISENRNRTDDLPFPSMLANS